MMVTTFMPATNKRTNLDCRYGIIVISPRGSVQQYHVYYICYSQNHEHTWTLTTYLQWCKCGVYCSNTDSLCALFINKQFRTCANAFPNEFTVRSYEYCAGKHWILYWIQENKTATYNDVNVVYIVVIRTAS
jgi:hypothetical protein